MSSRCVSSPTCPNGNCVGCRNGSLFCNDPRCYPDCPDCNIKVGNSNWVLNMIILILLGVLLIVSFIVIYDWYKSRNKAAEPKNITINRHIHTQPVSMKPKTTLNLDNPVSYTGVNLSMEGIPK